MIRYASLCGLWLLLAQAATAQSVDRFLIAVGDVVSNGVPDLGAGNLELADSIDEYVFTATAGQSVFFDLQEGGFGSSLRLSLLDPAGAPLLNGVFASDRGPIGLSQAGSYTLRLDDNSGQTGTYRFRLLDVPPPQRFSIAIGDVVDDGSPAPGAGNIESPGVVDIYTFTAAAGQSVFFDFQENPFGSTLRLSLEDPAGGFLLNGVLATDRGPIDLSQAGSYTLTIDDSSDKNGSYRFRVLDVPPPQRFTIAIGDVVADGRPTAGAGNIESPGVVDIYTFSAAAGQSLFIDVQENNFGSTLRLTLEDPSGGFLLNGVLASDRGPLTLPQAGNYTLILDDSQDKTGTYGFQLVDPALGTVIVTPTSGLLTTEAGGTDFTTLRLTAPPTASVVIGISSSDTSEGSVDQDSVEFTEANWDRAQTVTITGVDDTDADGDKIYTILTAPIVSDDQNYAGKAVEDVTVRNVDDDGLPDIVVSAVSATTDEFGTTAEVRVVLTSEPSASVTIALSSSDTSEGTVEPASLVFIPGSALQAQTVTVTGQDDNEVDGDVGYLLVTEKAQSADDSYQGRNPADVTLSNLDNDSDAEVGRIYGNSFEQ